MTRRTSLPPLASLLLCTLALAARAEPAATLTVEAADVARVNSPMTHKLDAAADLPAGAVTLTPSSGPSVPGQLDKTGDGAIVRWIEPNLPAGQSRSYAIGQTEKPAAVFHFSDGDGFRDLHYGDAKIWRDMIKWDPADRDNTFKPYQHVYAVGGDDFITKGPGGKFPHHRGIFFGFKAGSAGQDPRSADLRSADLGDFWHGRGVTQRHVKYLTEQEFAGPIAARCAAVTDWVGKDDKTAVIRDTRTETTWRVAPDTLVLDYDITVESLLDKPVRIFADAHHGGFHFRAAQEVAETSGANGKPGSAVYTRPASARNTGNDIWADCPWVQCAFEVKGKPYAVTLLDHPSNPRPTTFSTRPYGRFGAYFATEVAPAKPLRLKYRLIVRAGGGGAAPGASDADHASRDFAATP